MQRVREGVRLPTRWFHASSLTSSHIVANAFSDSRSHQRWRYFDPDSFSQPVSEPNTNAYSNACSNADSDEGTDKGAN